MLRGANFSPARVDYLSPAGPAIRHYAATRPLPAVEELRLHSRKRTPVVLLVLSGTDEDRAVTAFAANWFPAACAIRCIYVERGLDEDSYPNIYLARPIVGRVGGAGLDLKGPLPFRLCDLITHLFVGGALCFPFMRAKGIETVRRRSTTISFRSRRRFWSGPKAGRS